MNEFTLTEKEQKRVDALKEHDLLLCRIRRSHTMWQSVPVEKRTEGACNAMMLLPAHSASIIVPSSIPRIVEALDYLEAFRTRLVQERQAERERQAELRRIERANSQDLKPFDYSKPNNRFVNTIIDIACAIAVCYCVHKMMNGGL